MTLNELKEQVIGLGFETDIEDGQMFFNSVFRAVQNLDIELDSPTVFDVDGDAAEFAGKMTVRVTRPGHEVYIGDITSLLR